MLKKTISLLLALSMVLCVASFAYASTTQINKSCELHIDGNTVVCEGRVNAIGSPIDLTMNLLRNGRTVRTWNASGDDTLHITGSYAAISGSTYQLSFICYVDGNQITMPTKTITCP